MILKLELTYCGEPQYFALWRHFALTVCHTPAHNKNTWFTLSTAPRTKANKVDLALLKWQSGGGNSTTASSANHLKHTTLWLHVKFNFILFHLTAIFGKIYALVPSPHACVCSGSIIAVVVVVIISHENTMSEADFDSLYFEYIKLSFCYITLTTISFLNECAWIKFWTRACASPEIEFSEIKKYLSTAKWGVLAEDWVEKENGSPLLVWAKIPSKKDVIIKYEQIESTWC